MKKTTIDLPPGQILTVTSDAVSTGHVAREAQQPGGEPQGFTTVAASATKTFGPYAQTERFTIASDNGELSYSIGLGGALTNDNLAEEMSKITGWGDYADDQYSSGSPLALTGGARYELPINAQGGVISQVPDDVAAAGGFFVPSYLVVDDVTGFVVGETITGGTSSDTADIASIDTTNNRLYLENIPISQLSDAGGSGFTDTETITGGTSSTTATVSGTRVRGKVTGRNGDGISITVDFKVSPDTASTTYFTSDIDIGGSVGALYPRTRSLPKGQDVEHGGVQSFSGYTLDTWKGNGGVIYITPNAAVNIYEQRVLIERLHKARAT